MATPSALYAATVIVPTRGGRERLPTLIQALEAQDCPSFEVVVVIDGDIDNTAALMDSYRGPLHVRPVIFATNRGRSAALNEGIAAARGDILIRCDDDLAPPPSFVSTHIASHEAVGHPRGVVGATRNIFPETSYARVYGIRADELLRHRASTSHDTSWRHWGGNVSVSRETADRVGPYDEGYRAYGWEDADYGWRLHALGIEIVVEPALEVPHQLAAVTTSQRAQRAFYSGAARRRFVNKHDLSDLGPVRPSSSWNTAVWLLSRALDERRTLFLGGAVDRLLDRVPERAGRAMVGLVVEASSNAGYLKGSVSDPTAV